MHRAMIESNAVPGFRPSVHGLHFSNRYPPGPTVKLGFIDPRIVGVVDSDYCGPSDEIKVPVINVTPGPVTIAAGDRLAQGILLPAPRVEWEEVSKMASASRGGFGSTGPGQ